MSMSTTYKNEVLSAGENSYEQIKYLFFIYKHKAVTNINMTRKSAVVL